MAKLSFIKTTSGLVPHTEHDKAIFDAWKLGAVISGEFKQIRNARLHRKFFSLLNLAFDYWDPEGGFLSSSERALSSKIFKLLDDHNGNNGFFLEFGRGFLRDEIELRKSQIENIHKSFEVFRHWAVETAGFYDIHPTPTGQIKIAKSISFAKMDDLEFIELYKSVFAVLWRFVLSRAFDTEAEAEAAAVLLLNYT